MSEQNHLVDVRGLKEYFPIRSGIHKVMLKAVDDVSFTIDEGETLGLVGESGCGKTTVGRTLLHLYKPTAGEVYFDGQRVTEKNIGDFRKDMQIVFQDPYSSLNPRMTVGQIISEGMIAHNQYRKNDEELRELIEHCMDHGLKGMECRYSGYGPERVAYLEALAEEYGLLKTGGSDFHGQNKPRIHLGSGIDDELAVPYEWLERLREAAQG